MVLGILVIIISYLFFSIAFFGDKLMLSGHSNAKLYAFYIGVLSALVVVFIPFIGFGLPSAASLLWIILDGAAYVLGIYTMFLALEKFEVSRVMPTVGALQPIFIVVLTWFFWGPQLVPWPDVVAFGLLLVGSVVISLEKKLTITRDYILLLSCSALFFSLDYVFSKMVFLNQPFLQGLIWMRLAGLLVALLFLFSRQVRGQIFSKKITFNKKAGGLFLGTQSAGGIAGMLQSFAIALTPVAYLAVINSLRGVQYIFLFLITVFFSFFFPKIFKEDISGKVIAQKIISIMLIVAGLVILVSH